jgi:hypothetical protein
MVGQIYLVNNLISLSFLKKDVKLILFYGIAVIVVFWVSCQNIWWLMASKSWIKYINLCTFVVYFQNFG